MKAGLGDLMRQAQKMQAELKKAQESVSEIEVTGDAGGGMVRITLTGKYQVLRVHIDHSVVGDDKEMLEDLIAAAMNSAVGKVETAIKEKMSGLTAGMSLPLGLNLPL